MFAQIAKANNIPVYIIADSLKYTSKPITIEQRNKQEIWNKKAIKNQELKMIVYDWVF